MNKLIEDFVILDESLPLSHNNYYKACNIKTKKPALVKIISN